MSDQWTELHPQTIGDLLTESQIQSLYAGVCEEHSTSSSVGEGGLMGAIQQWERDIWSQMTLDEQQRIKDKCNWEHMTRFAVLREWQSLIPERLQHLIEED